MKISNTMLAALFPAMLSLAPLAAHAAAPTVTVFNSTALGFGGDVVLTINGVDYTAFNSGHYDNLGGNIQTNYQAGFDGFNNNPESEVRNFFTFDLSSLTGPITSATLTIPSNPFGIGYENTSGTASITYTNWDVSTPIDDLDNFFLARAGRRAPLERNCGIELLLRRRTRRPFVGNASDSGRFRNGGHLGL